MAPRGITGRQPASYTLAVVELVHKAPSLLSEPHARLQRELTLKLLQPPTFLFSALPPLLRSTPVSSWACPMERSVAIDEIPGEWQLSHCLPGSFMKMAMTADCCPCPPSLDSPALRRVRWDRRGLSECLLKRLAGVCSSTRAHPLKSQTLEG